MAYAVVAVFAMQFGATSWTHTFTQNNLAMVLATNDSSVTPGATDFKDSSGTPKNLNLNKSSGLFTVAAAAAYSLVVPAGFTSPLKGLATVTWMGIEWSGNATSSVVDNSASTGSSGSTASPLTGTSLTTGANAGLVVTALTVNTGNAASGLTVTGTNFSDTFSASHDGTDQNDNTQDAGTGNWNTTSVASTTLHNSWSWTGGNMANRAEVIVSYNVSGGGGGGTPVPPPMRTMRGAGV